MGKNRICFSDASESKPYRAPITGFDGPLLKSLCFRATIAVILFIIASTAFFLCRDSNPSKRFSNLRSGEKASYTPTQMQTGVRRSGTFAAGTFISGIDVSGMNERDAKKSISAKTNRLFSEYECKLHHGEKSFTLNKNDIKLESNIDDVIQNALEQGGGEYVLEVRPADDSRLRDAIATVSDSIDSPPKDSELLSAAAAGELQVDEIERNSRFIVAAPIDGISVDIEKTARLMLDGARDLELPVRTISASDYAPSLPQRRAFFFTSFNSPALSVDGRVHNIKKAALLINSRALEPGKKLSCNDVFGERSQENGWQAATAFASGGKETEQQYGGGICQVSTTLYNCALMAGLEVTNRIGHSRKVAYVDGGRDAALSWGTADLVIRNNTSETVYFFMWTDDTKKCLMCEIYGGAFPEEYDEITILSELIETSEPNEPEFITDNSLNEGDCVPMRSAIRGSVYDTYLEYRKNGVALRKEPVSRTPYPAIPALYAVPPKSQD